EQFDMAPYAGANAHACTTRFSIVATRCLGGDWSPLMERAVQTAKLEGIPAAVNLLFNVTRRLRRNGCSERTLTEALWGRKDSSQKSETVCFNERSQPMAQRLAAER